MLHITQLRNEQIDAPYTPLFYLYDDNNEDVLAIIGWLGKSVDHELIYTPCVTISQDGVNVSYDGNIIAGCVDNINGSPTIAPSADFAWYSKDIMVENNSSYKDLKNGTVLKFATPEDTTGNKPEYTSYRSLLLDNSSLRLSNLNVWNNDTMTGSCCDLRFGMHYSSQGKRVLVAQAAIDILSNTT